MAIIYSRDAIFHYYVHICEWVIETDFSSRIDIYGNQNGLTVVCSALIPNVGSNTVSDRS